MKRILTLASFAFVTLVAAQNQAFTSTANLSSQTNINTYLDQIQSLGVKTTGSTANANALSWLKTKYTGFGYATTDIVEHAFTAKASNGVTYSGKNLIVTKQGSGVNKAKYIIVCGHYDTINGTGTNDNGSGVSVILELARVIKNIPTDYTIKFINFSGEEQGLLGSKAYVTNVIGTGNKNLYFVLNIDEIGGVSGLVNDTITCESDQTSTGGTTNNATSKTITQQLATYMAYYSGLKTVLSNAYASDYMPFEAKGYVITGLFETNETTKKHTSADTKVNMDPAYVGSISKGLIGAVLNFAGATVTTTARVTPTEENLEIYADNTKQVVGVKNTSKDSRYEIYDILGKKLLEGSNGKEINVSTLPKGNYVITVYSNGKTYSKTFIK